MQTENQLLRNKVKYLESRLDNIEKSVGSINKILGQFQRHINLGQGFQDIHYEELMRKGEVDDSYNMTGKKTDNHELI